MKKKSIALVSADGTQVKSLRLSTIPPGFEVPNGQYLSCRFAVHINNHSLDERREYYGGLPKVANFYRKQAFGTLEFVDAHLVATIQSSDPSDLSELMGIMNNWIKNPDCHWPAENRWEWRTKTFGGFFRKKRERQVLVRV